MTRPAVRRIEPPAPIPDEGMVCYVRRPGEPWVLGEDTHRRAYARFRTHAENGVMEDVFLAGDMMRLGTMRAITNERVEFISRNGLHRLELYSCQREFLQLE